MPVPRAAARTFQDLVVWRKAHELVLAVYSFTAAFPKEETYGLALQMRRAAVSVPANIAEGFRRRGRADKARYMNMAEGSLEESRYYLILAQDLGYGDANSLTTALGERWHSVQFQGIDLSSSDVVSLQVLEKQSKKLLCAHVFDRSCGGPKTNK